MAIYWEEKLSTGVPAIDEQHKDIFANFEELSKAIEAGRCSDEIVKLLNYLEEYANSHFLDEENLMSLYKYPGLEEQRQQHILFKENITDLLAMLANKVPTKEIAIKIDSTLIRYFINHVRKLDSKLCDFIKNSMEQRPV
jgi:hemerythrin